MLGPLSGSSSFSSLALFRGDGNRHTPSVDDQQYAFIAAIGTALLVMPDTIPVIATAQT